jgi:hypothetical protein
MVLGIGAIALVGAAPVAVMVVVEDGGKVSAALCGLRPARPETVCAPVRGTGSPCCNDYFERIRGLENIWRPCGKSATRSTMKRRKLVSWLSGEHAG